MLRLTKLDTNQLITQSVAQSFKHPLGTRCHLYIPRTSSTLPHAHPPESYAKLEDQIEHQIELKRFLQKQKYQNHLEDRKCLRKLAKDELRSLRELAVEVSSKAKGVVPQETISDSTEQVYEAIQKPDLVSGSNETPPKYSFPPQINEKLGLASTYLTPTTDSLEFKPKWGLILNQLELSGGFRDLDTTTVQAFIKIIPPADLKKFLPRLHQMCLEAGIKLTPKIELFFFKALAAGGEVSSTEIQAMENFFDAFMNKNDQKIDYYETMVCGYVKNRNMKKVEKLLNTMQLRNVEISRSILSSILQGYVYYVGDHEKAWEIFNAMKFLSKKTQPNLRNYTDMIFSFVKSNRLEGALDLYQEMLDNNVPLNQNILASLARGCSKSKRFAIRSWEFIFRIYDQGWLPNLQTYESMLNVAAFEGALDLSRALLFKMIQGNSVTSKALLYLMISYSNYSSADSKKRTGIELSERGRLFKQKIMEGVDFAEKQNGFPFLPVTHIPNNDTVFAEASAIVSFLKEVKPWLLTPQLVTSYLSTCIRLGSMESFKSQYEGLTKLEVSGIPRSETVPVSSVGHLEINQYKIARDTPIYIVALKAAAKFKDYDFAKEILEERGKYRKSDAFQKMSRKAQHLTDFDFARALVECFKDLQMFKDALSVVLLSEDRFSWSWRELGGLVGAVLKVEDLQMAEEIKRVIRSSKNRR